MLCEVALIDLETCDSEASNCTPGYCGISNVAFIPTASPPENACGTCTKMRTRCKSDTSNSGMPEPPELISCPSSTFRAVTTPSNGADSVLNDCMASSCRTLASLASTTAFFAVASAE